jgi:NitT/TauT family transport system substrate-binding protein
MRQIWLLGFTVLLLALPLEAADKVRLSISALDVSFLTAGVASKRGFFKDEGLDVEVIRMNANVSIPALSTGDIDYTMVFASVIRGALRGLPMKVVASFMDSSTHMLIARPEHKAVKDLRGKTLGVSTFGATADVAARMMMRHSGIDPEREIKIIALGPDRARFAALKEGIVDVIVISPPADSEAKKLGFNVLARTYELFNFPFTGVGSTTKKLREKPDEVKRMIKSGIRANRYLRQNRDGAIQVLMEWGKTDREAAANTYDSTWPIFSEDGSLTESGLKVVIDQAKQSMNIDRPVAISDVADFGFVRDAQKQLGIKGR